MYYNRTISKELASLLEKSGELRWLFDFVKNHSELDFLIGKNNSKEWISVYRGLTRIVSISKSKKSTIQISGAGKYENLVPNLYGRKQKNENFQKGIELLINQIEQDRSFDRYYNNMKEGYYQNELSRKYGIYGSPDSAFVIIDKETVIGYKDTAEKNDIFGSIQHKYKLIQKLISQDNPKRYGKDLESKAIGNELDFLALDKAGNILLIEYKHGNNTSGIYLSPLQIGLYFDIFTKYPKPDLESAVLEMLEQKKKTGLINPDWKVPDTIKEIIPVLIISEYDEKSSAKVKFDEILQFTRDQVGLGFLSNLRTFNFTMKNGLSDW